MTSSSASSRSRLLVAFLIGLFGASEATADESADKKKAQALFMEGRAAVEKGDKVNGCAKLRESLGIFTVANTLFNVAQCDEGEGKLASALEHWQRGLALIEPKDPRAPIAKKQIAALEPRVPRLRIVIPPRQTVSAVVLDGEPLPLDSLSTPLTVDPGKHVIVVQSPGRSDRRHEMELAERERTEFVATPSSAPSGGSSDGPSGSDTTTTTPPASNARRTAGFVVGGVGVLGLIAAGATGFGVISADGDIDAIDTSCAKGDNCDLEARKPLVSRYRALVWANTTAWGVGVVGLGAGLVMILTAPTETKGDVSPRAAVAPVFLPGGAGLSVSGRF